MRRFSLKQVTYKHIERKREGGKERIREGEKERREKKRNININKMVCKDYEGLLMDYFSGDIAGNNLKLLLSHLEACEKCRDKFEQMEVINKTFDLLPDLKLNGNSDIFRNDKIIQELIKEGQRAGLAKISWKILIPAGIAASIILFIAGFYTGRTQKENHFKDQEIAALRSEINETKNLMILSLLKQQSASKRIQAASYAEKLDELQPDVIDALLHSLNTDLSTNVRLASLEALSKYTDNPLIRAELIKTFDQEADPVIQVNMINLMVLMNEKSSAYIMQRLVNDDNTQLLVKDQARKGLEILL